MKRRTFLTGAAASLVVPLIPWPEPLKQFWVTRQSGIQWIHIYKPQTHEGTLYVPLNNGYGADFAPDAVLTVDRFLEKGWVSDLREKHPSHPGVPTVVGRPTDAWIDRPTMTLVTYVKFYDHFRGFAHPRNTGVLSGVGGIVHEVENFWDGPRLVQRADLTEVLLFQP